MKLCKNVGWMMDFDDAKDASGIEFSLNEGDWDSETKTINVQSGKFFSKLQGVSDLNILLSSTTTKGEERSEMDTRTRLDGISFFGDT
ncbi:hypothetical protein ABW20_dc0106177 [Dactylellina cionopaga]|nr:hypothetical protein ABW20_dc0106177 [Dactylellina cionopaga]